jgi:glycerol-3-phosphate O-acyltransferase
VTQGIFLEGGLSRDGKLRPTKIGLLDYVLGIAREPEYRARMYIVPVAVNYDRVLEDRSLLQELAASEGKPRPSRLRQFADVTHYVAWNVARLLTRRWKRYGRAAVLIGNPIPLAPWFEREHELFSIPRAERLARVQALSDDILARIGALVPVTAVALTCAAIQSLDSDFIGRETLLERMTEMRSALVELNARVLRADRGIEETFDRAWRMLQMRRMLARSGGGYAVLPRGRPLINYYANSIAHLLGPFESAVRARDELPAARVSR